MAAGYNIPKPYTPPYPIPPGESLKDILDARGITQGELARRMDCPEQTVSEILNANKAITEETAIQLERSLGLPAYFWLRMEKNYQAALGREADRRHLSG